MAIRPAVGRLPRMPLYTLESFLKLRNQRCFASLETIPSHDAPEKIAAGRRACVVHRQHIFGRPACHKDDDVSFGRLIHNDQLSPFLNCVLHSTNRGPILWKQVGIELISVIGGHVDITRIR